MKTLNFFFCLCYLLTGNAQLEKLALLARNGGETLDSIITREFDSVENEWQFDAKFIFSYQAKKKSREIFQNWDPEQQNWQNSVRRDYGFLSENSLPDTITNLRWDDDSGQWIGIWSTRDQYDEEGKWLRGFYYEFDAEEDQWVQVQKTELQYDGDRLSSKLISGFIPLSGLWKPVLKYDYFTDTQIQKDSTLHSAWVDLTQTWAPVEKYVSYPMLGDTLDLNLAYKWINSAQNWLPQTRTEGTYQDGGSIYQLIIYEYDSPTGEWHPETQRNYHYDAWENLISFDRYVYEAATDSWQPRSENIYTLDYNVPSDELTAAYPYDFTHKVLHYEIRRFIPAENAWFDYKMDNYYYSFSSAQFEMQESPHLRLLPNPCKDIMHIYAANTEEKLKVEIFDMSGKLKMSKEIINGQAVGTERLEAGQYLVRVLIRGEIRPGIFIRN